MLREVNLKSRVHTNPEAVDIVSIALANARLGGQHVLKIIHGYGSGGIGGSNKEAIHAFLSEFASKGKIRKFIPGEQLQSADVENLKRRFSGHTHSFESLKKDRGNQGITIVLI